MLSLFPPEEQRITLHEITSATRLFERHRIYVGSYEDQSRALQVIALELFADHNVSVMTCRSIKMRAWRFEIPSGNIQISFAGVLNKAQEISNNFTLRGNNRWLNREGRLNFALPAPEPRLLLLPVEGRPRILIGNRVEGTWGHLQLLTSCAGTMCHARREFFVPKLQYFLSFQYV